MADEDGACTGDCTGFGLNFSAGKRRGGSRCAVAEDVAAKTIKAAAPTRKIMDVPPVMTMGAFGAKNKARRWRAL